MIDEQAGVYDHCEVCGEAVDNCICPECPKCGCVGDMRCYNETHGLIPTFEQILRRDWNEALIEQESRQEDEAYEEYYSQYEGDGEFSIHGR